ncbi:hypothetical protein Agabi119p4_5221 [Agaricus bisporus var. burnettii]|uniref:Uncharacterized protein n=1 Tax=Agaricus bisporus var. burnettii TaxID=192524 RepID=A0A8H7F4Y9_AGABI|nr:hypothetical protein Agabi119p4_5221 [Agaricus bisporus var. burnettii]
METLRESRRTMGSKMIPLRDVMLTGRDFSRHYIEFVDGVSEDRMLTAYVKGAYTVIAQKAATKAKEAQQALTEFREELESVVARVTSSMDGDNNDVSSFITESRLIVSTMVTAIEECNSLLEEFKEMFLNIDKQAFNIESYERNTPSDEEYELVGEKWEKLKILLHNISLDWNLLELRIEVPHMGNPTSDDTPDMDNPTYDVTPFASQDARDAFALTGIPENPVNPEAQPKFPPSEKTKVPFWQKFFQRLSSHFSSKRFC